MRIKVTLMLKQKRLILLSALLSSLSIADEADYTPSFSKQWEASQLEKKITDYRESVTQEEIDKFLELKKNGLIKPKLEKGSPLQIFGDPENEGFSGGYTFFLGLPEGERPDEFMSPEEGTDHWLVNELANLVSGLASESSKDPDKTGSFSPFIIHEAVSGNREMGVLIKPDPEKTIDLSSIEASDFEYEWQEFYRPPGVRIENFDQFKGSIFANNPFSDGNLYKETINPSSACNIAALFEFEKNNPGMHYVMGTKNEDGKKYFGGWDSRLSAEEMTATLGEGYMTCHSSVWFGTYEEATNSFPDIASQEIYTTIPVDLNYVRSTTAFRILTNHSDSTPAYLEDKMLTEEGYAGVHLVLNPSNTISLPFGVFMACSKPGSILHQDGSAVPAQCQVWPRSERPARWTPEANVFVTQHEGWEPFQLYSEYDKVPATAAEATPPISFWNELWREAYSYDTVSSNYVSYPDNDYYDFETPMADSYRVCAWLNSKEEVEACLENPEGNVEECIDGFCENNYSYEAPS